MANFGALMSQSVDGAIVFFRPDGVVVSLTAQEVAHIQASKPLVVEQSMDCTFGGHRNVCPSCDRPTTSMDGLILAELRAIHDLLECVTAGGHSVVTGDGF